MEHAPLRFTRTLEIGGGLGEHLEYEKLDAVQRQNQIALELRETFASEIRRRFPNVQVYVGDCQLPLDLPDHSFDMVLVVHVLEHLPNLPATIREVHRLPNKQHGVYNSEAYFGPKDLRTEISAILQVERKQRFINKLDEILEEALRFFSIVHHSFFPLSVLPVAAFNLCIGVTMKPRR